MDGGASQAQKGFPMSIRSMTGFGRGEASADGVKAVVEIGSVNRRQMDIYVVLPKALQIMEPRIHEEIHHWVSRGRIKGEVLISRSAKSGEKMIRVDESLADAYVKALRKTAKKIGLEDSFSGDLLLTLPDVVSFEQTTDDPEKVWPLLLKALKRSLKDFDTMRRHEGIALQKDLQNRVRLLGKYWSVSPNAPRRLLRVSRALFSQGSIRRGSILMRRTNASYVRWFSSPTRLISRKRSLAWVATWIR